MTETTTPPPEAAGQAPEPDGTGKELAEVKVALDMPISDLDAAMRLAKTLMWSNILPENLRNKPANVLVLMMYGRDLGMTPMQAFQAIYVVNGKPQLSAEGWTALARRAGHRIHWLESTRETAKVQITLADDPDHPHVEEFTIDDAIAAHLVTRGEDGTLIARDSKGNAKPWELYTKRMLRARALAFGMRSIAPEVALGFGISLGVDLRGGEGDDVADAEDTGGFTVVEVDRDRMRTNPGPGRSQADLQADVLAAEGRFAAQGAPDPTSTDSDVHDAEVVDDEPNIPDDPKPTPPPTSAAGEDQVDDEATLFARADEQAAAEMGDDDA